MRLAVILGVVLGVLVPACDTYGQVILHSDPYASSGGSPHKNVVRNAAGTLFAISVLETAAGEREVILQSSSDGGISWSTSSFIFNDDTSGLSGTNLANTTSVAIDDTGRLHVIWGRYYYPSFYQQYYRRYDPVTDTASDIVDVSALTGAAETSRTAAMEIIVDGTNTVWLAAHGPSSWVERLVRSTEPYAENLEFEDLGPISPTASAQNSRLAIDADGLVHATFYRNTGAGNYEHRIYDPAGGWDPGTTVLGNTTPTNDFYGALVADALGNVHVLLVADAGTGSTWLYRYRRWDASNGWGPEVALMDATPDDYDGIANYKLFTLGCDETDGKVFALYRDITDGAPLRLAELELGSDTFVPIDDLQPPASGLHEYYIPTIRGTLYPAFNNAAAGLHVTWQNRPVQGVPPYNLYFDAPLGAGGVEFKRGDADGDGNFVGLVDGLFILFYQFQQGSPEPPCLDAVDVDDDGVFSGLVDALYALNFQFGGGAPPPPPGVTSCGPDPTPDSIPCAASPGCP